MVSEKWNSQILVKTLGLKHLNTWIEAHMLRWCGVEGFKGSVGRKIVVCGEVSSRISKRGMEKVQLL
jgi:hypothetical protein